MNVKAIKLLVDRLAEVRGDMKILKKEEEEIKTVLTTLGQKIILGEHHILLIKDAERLSLDLDRIKEEMGEDWYKEHQLVTYFLKFDIENIEDQTL